MRHIKLLFAALITMFLMNSFVLAQDTTMTITENGKVGIGTTAPRTQLHVFEGITTGGTLASPSAGAITLLPPDGFAFFHIDNGPAGGRPTGRLRFSHGGAPGDIEIMTLTQAGRVGIGTTNPAFLLDVFGTNYKVRYNSGGNVDVLINRASNSNFGNLQYASGNTLLWAIGLRGVSAADGLFFHDEDAGTTRMMIDGTSGNVGIGTTSPSFPLEMGSGAHVTAGGVWTDASSRQYKENISNLTPEEAIAALENLNPVKFNYKLQKDEEYIGFIAEDVPDLVATKDRKSLSPMDIVAVLTKVVQQQQKKIAELEARFNATQ